MRRFEYIRPTTIDEATQFLSDNADDTLVIAGGTAAVVLLHLGVLRPQYVLDIGGIVGLRERSTHGSLRLGALVSIRTIERDANIARDYDVLADAASQVANVRVRNVATVGGTIAYGEPQTDTPVALTALGAIVEVAGASGRREVPIADFYQGPYETALQAGELVSAVNIPRPVAGSVGCHLKFTVGSPENKPVANVSTVLTLDGAGKCVGATVVLGAVGASPVVAKAAAGLIGQSMSDDLIRTVAETAAEETDPIEDMRGPVWYKRRIARVLTERALTCALQKTQV